MRKERKKLAYTTVAMIDNGSMLKRATLAVGEVTSRPAVTSAGAVDGEVRTTKDASSNVAFARRVASSVRAISGAQIVAARHSLASVRVRPKELAASLVSVMAIDPIITSCRQEARKTL